MSIHDGLLMWVVVLKDLHQKVSIVLDEVELVRESLSYLRVYDSDADATPAQPSILFDDLHRGLGPPVSELVDLREAIRDDLVVLHMLLDDVTYDELTRPTESSPDGESEEQSSAVFPYPSSDDSKAEQYARAIDVVTTSEAGILAGAVQERLRLCPEIAKLLGEKTIDLQSVSEYICRNAVLSLGVKLREQPFLQSSTVRRQAAAVRREAAAVVEAGTTSAAGKWRAWLLDWLASAIDSGRMSELVSAAVEVPSVPFLLRWMRSHWWLFDTLALKLPCTRKRVYPSLIAAIRRRAPWAFKPSSKQTKGSEEVSPELDPDGIATFLEEDKKEQDRKARESSARAGGVAGIGADTAAVRLGEVISDFLTQVVFNRLAQIFSGALRPGVAAPGKVGGGAAAGDSPLGSEGTHTVKGELESWLSSESWVEIVKVAGELVERVVQLGDHCWESRRLRVLERVAMANPGKIMEVDDIIPSPIHEMMFQRVSDYHGRLPHLFGCVRSILQAIQQRSTALPESFQAPPRSHRRPGEAIETRALRLLHRFEERARDLLRLFSRDERLHDFTVDLSFEFAPTSSMYQHNPSSRSRSVIVAVPFFHFFMPRHLAEVVHELAHVYVPTEEIAELAMADADEQAWKEVAKRWTGRIGFLLRRTLLDLARVYRTEGTKLDVQAGLLAETFADLVAMLIVGPHYLYSQLFSTIGHVYLPGCKPVDGAAAVSPMVRIGALIRIALWLWPWDEATPAGTPDTRPHLRPLRALTNAYFRILHQRAEAGDWEEARRLRLFVAEMDILYEGLRRVLLELSAYHPDVLVRPPRDHPRKKSSAPVVKPASDERPVDLAGDLAEVFMVARKVRPEGARYVDDDGRPIAESSDAAAILRAASRYQRSAAASCERPGQLLWTPSLALGASEDGRRRNLADDNTIHLLWSAVLDRYFHRREWDRETTAKVVWMRAPELRLLLELDSRRIHWGAAARPPSPSPARGSPAGESLFQDGDVVSVVQVDAVWHGASAEDAFTRLEERIGPRRLAHWVLGDHDFQIMMLRVRGTDDLRARRTPVRELLPDSPRHSYIRSQAYVVEHCPLSRRDACGPDAAQPAELAAFLRLRLAGDHEHDEVRGVILDTMEPGNGVNTEILLRSLGWDHYAIQLGFDSFQSLSDATARLRSALHAKKLYVEQATTCVLWRPSPSPAPASGAGTDFDWKKPPSAAIVSRFRCKGDDNSKSVVTRVREAAVPEDDVAGAPGGQAGWVRVLAMETTSLDHVEVRVEAAPGTELGKSETRHLLSVYGRTMQRILGAARVQDVHTSVLLPERRSASIISGS